MDENFADFPDNTYQTITLPGPRKGGRSHTSCFLAGLAYMAWALFGLKISPENYENLWRDDYEKRPVLSATIHPDIKRTLVAISEFTWMCVSQVTDEVLYTCLIEMQELWGVGGVHWPHPSIHKVVRRIYA